LVAAGSDNLRHAAAANSISRLDSSFGGLRLPLRYALACLRAGVRTISMAEPNEKIADIARRMGAELVRRPT
jgi:hypothetical protein